VDDIQHNNNDTQHTNELNEPISITDIQHKAIHHNDNQHTNELNVPLSIIDIQHNTQHN
jgi:hypothetical protein